MINFHSWNQPHPRQFHCPKQSPHHWFVNELAWISIDCCKCLPSICDIENHVKMIHLMFRSISATLSIEYWCLLLGEDINGKKTRSLSNNKASSTHSHLGQATSPKTNQKLPHCSHSINHNCNHGIHHNLQDPAATTTSTTTTNNNNSHNNDG